MEERKILLGLQQLLGSQRANQLLKMVSPEEAWQLGAQALRSLVRWQPATIDQYISNRKSIDLGQVEEQLARHGVRYLSLVDPQYPPALAAIFDPPPVIFIKGELEVLREPAISIVGSRRPTAYGRGVSEELAAELSRRGIVVVSGLARGIDTAAHIGALKHGRTVAVIANGLDVAYPQANRGLQQKIAQNGVVVSEFPLGTKPEPWHFPLRNRIISGLSLGTVVVEAQASSGSLITADQALEQGREVFAVPGPITSSLSMGCHNLIKQGAKLVSSVEDILEEVGLATLGEQKHPKGDQNHWSEQELQVLKVLQELGAVKADMIVQKLGLSVPQVAFILTNLEIAGIVTRSSGQIYSLKQLCLEFS